MREGMVMRILASDMCLSWNRMVETESRRWRIKMNSWDDEMLWGWTAMDTQRQCSQCHTNTVKILMFATDFYSNFLKKGILEGPSLLRLNVKKII